MRCQLALPGIAALALLLALAAQPVQAQLYKLEHAPSPAPFSLSTHYFFHVNAQRGAPTSASGAQASVEFRKLAAHQTPKGQLPSDYNSLEVSILPYDKFWDLVDRNQFCTAKRANRCCQLSLTKPEGSTLEEIGVRTQAFPLGSETGSVAFPINVSGKYVLTVSNCGNYSEATLTGSIAVRHAHGYLPAYEFNTMRIAGWFTVIYTGIFVVWTSATVRYFKALVYIQKGIMVISLICVLEAFCMWLDHQDWNTTGDRRDSLFFLSLALYTLKYVIAWRLLLLIALGVGLVVEDLGMKASVAFYMVSALFMLQSTAWKMIVAYRHSYAVDSTFLLLVTIPGILIYTGMFGWTLLALSSAKRHIKEQRQEKLTGVLRKMRLILIVGFLLSSINTTVQTLDLAMDLLSWDHAWFSVDGAPQFSFMAVLIATMVVWRPTPDSWKYGYQLQNDVAQEEEGAEDASPPRVTLEDDDHIQADSRKAKAEKELNTVVPEAIGAREGVKREGEDGENLL